MHLEASSRMTIIYELYRTYPIETTACCVVTLLFSWWIVCALSDVYQGPKWAVLSFILSPWKNEANDLDAFPQIVICFQKERILDHFRADSFYQAQGMTDGQMALEDH